VIHFSRDVVGVVRVGIVVLQRFLPDIHPVVLMRFDEKSAQKLSGLAIIEVRSLYIPAQKKFRVGLGRAFDDSVEL
jgi:hypothetical protein